MKHEIRGQGVIKLFGNSGQYNELLGVLEFNNQSYGLFSKPIFGATYHSDVAGFELHINCILNQADQSKFEDALVQLWDTHKTPIEFEVTIYDHNLAKLDKNKQTRSGL